MYRAIAAALVAMLLAAPTAMAETIDGSRIYVLDGDTVSLPCAKLGRYCSERVRIANIDAPEIFHPDCDAGLQLGLAAKDVLAEILRDHKVVISRWKNKDPYFRTLATLTVDGQDVGRQLVEAHVAFPWKSGATAKAWRIVQWCP
jgi:endonuclease YncB( thermonuclease family)